MKNLPGILFVMLSVSETTAQTIVLHFRRSFAYAQDDKEGRLRMTGKKQDDKNRHFFGHKKQHPYFCTPKILITRKAQQVSHLFENASRV